MEIKRKHAGVIVVLKSEYCSMVKRYFLYISFLITIIGVFIIYHNPSSAAEQMYLLQVCIKQ